MWKRKWTLAAVSALLLGATLPASAADKVIRISSWASPNHGINSMVWPTWGKWVEEATDGRVTVKVEYNMGPPPAQADIVADGIGDVTWFSTVSNRAGLNLPNCLKYLPLITTFLLKTPLLLTGAFSIST